MNAHCARATNNAAFRDARSNALRRIADDADGRRAAHDDAGGFVFTAIVGTPRSDARRDDAMVRCDVRATPRARRCSRILRVRGGGMGRCARAGEACGRA